MLGHEKPLERLYEALNTGRMSHAYIFEGIPGIGKFQAATHMARRVLCESSIGCGTCASCMKVDSGNHPDFLVIEADGASIKNQQVEDFQNFVVLKPNEGRYRVAIIRNGETMTESAQNRLLKVLEEPAGQTLIIITADQITGLLATIRSRAQTIPFERLSTENLHAIALQKGWESDDDMLMFADGSAEALERITSDKQLGNSIEQVFLLLECLKNRRYVQAVDIGNTVAKKREDFSLFLSLLLYAARDLLMMERESDRLSQLYFKAHEDRLMKVGFGLTPVDILRMMEGIQEMQMYVKANVNSANAFDSLVLKLQEVYCD